MTLFVDTSALRSRARQLDAAADDVRTRALALQTAADQARWLSLAAARYRAESGKMHVDLVRAADALAHAADLLRAHAVAIDNAWHAIAALPASTLHAGERVVSAGVDGATSAVRTVAGWL